MKVKERGYELKVQCRMCRKTHSLMVGIEDHFMFEMPNRPHIQDIFPYLTPAERELLISGVCGECWEKMFPPEEDYPDDDDDDDDHPTCGDCPDDECTGHCMSCSYRP